MIRFRSAEKGETPIARVGDTHYQLTHDYLVPPLRQWLSRKQRQTRRGRAELQLASITAAWCDRPETRRLPSLLEWLRILIFTRPTRLDHQSTADDETGDAAFHRSARRAPLLVVGASLYAIGTVCSRERAHVALETALPADYSSLPPLLDDLRIHVAYAAARPGADREERSNLAAGSRGRHPCALPRSADA